MFEVEENTSQVHVTPRMKGVNELHFCGVEIQAIVQEYLNARMSSYAPFVMDVRVQENYFVVRVTDEAPSA